MVNLWFVSFLWAFSFSLIGVYLAGSVDAYISVLIRLGLATACFLPWLPWRKSLGRLPFKLMGIGAVQLGMMYSFYFHGFLYLSVAEVLLFTIMTPIYIALLEDLLARRFTPAYLLAAALSVGGAAVINYQGVNTGFWNGFALMQGANLCFATGQVAYRRVMANTSQKVTDLQVFGYFFVGAFIFAALAAAVMADLSRLPQGTTQWGVLLWLGILASGVGTWLWNSGARRVNAGSLSVMNNLVIPLGIAVNLLLWERQADIPRLLMGSLIICVGLVVARFQSLRRAKFAD